MSRLRQQSKKTSSSTSLLSGSFLKAMIKANLYGKAINGVIDGLRSAVVNAAGIEEQLTRTAIATGATNEEMMSLSKTVSQLAGQTPFTESEIAAATKIMGRAGVGVSQIENTIEQITQFARLGETDLTSAAQSMVTVSKTFGRELSKASITDALDKMNVAAKSSMANCSGARQRFHWASEHSPPRWDSASKK